MLSTMSEQQRSWPLGPTLRHAREEAGLSQRAAAKAAGFSVTVWSQLETGVRSVGNGQTVPASPRPETVRAAAKVVGIDPNEALRQAGLPPVSIGDKTGPPTISQRRHLQRWAQLTTDQQRALELIIISMLEAPPPDDSTDATFVTSVHATDADLEESYSEDAGPGLRVRR